MQLEMKLEMQLDKRQLGPLRPNGLSTAKDVRLDDAL